MLSLKLGIIILYSNEGNTTLHLLYLYRILKLNCLFDYIQNSNKATNK